MIRFAWTFEWTDLWVYLLCGVILWLNFFYFVDDQPVVNEVREEMEPPSAVPSQENRVMGTSRVVQAEPEQFCSEPVPQWGPPPPGYTTLIDWLAQAAAKQEAARRLRGQQLVDLRRARIAASRAPAVRFSPLPDPPFPSTVQKIISPPPAMTTPQPVVSRTSRSAAEAGNPRIKAPIVSFETGVTRTQVSEPERRRKRPRNCAIPTGPVGKRSRASEGPPTAPPMIDVSAVVRGLKRVADRESSLAPSPKRVAIREASEPFTITISEAAAEVPAFVTTSGGKRQRITPVTEPSVFPQVAVGEASQPLTIRIGSGATEIPTSITIRGGRRRRIAPVSDERVSEPSRPRRRAFQEAVEKIKRPRREG